MPAFTIRPATANDLDAVRAIFNYYVTHSTCTFQIAPETAEERLAWFRGRTECHPVTVAEAGGEIIGWAALSPWKSRCAYAGSAEASVYVHHAHHRRGVGKALLLDLITRARAAGLHTIIGGTTTDQSASLALQLALGFESVGTFREVGYKFDRWLDVTYTQLMLTGAPVPACPSRTA
ncbi:GNAT family N-acetyltransferase [Frigoriglobus tundricola]|uniref:Acetyltransferase, GNAT family n=1 Tax=Frigoriglobus tundricola TaxID=2774151 RepID=A0A6M5YVM0_9BACT|nr:GNAT family N-acetyltransferase [Frigoriglobus tundricola]QJW97988.1 Acetyltransferase, GNAT family [Frigoriglobus tundricola]